MDRQWVEWAKDISKVIEGQAKDMANLQRFQNSYEVKLQIDAMVQLNEKLQVSAANYTNLIMVAGYVGFFAFGGTLSSKVPDWLFSLSGFLILISLTLFISWEITKMIWLANHMKKISGILAGQKGPQVISQYEAAFTSYQNRSQSMWRYFLFPTIATGIGAALCLVGYFGVALWKIAFK